MAEEICLESLEISLTSRLEPKLTKGDLHLHIKKDPHELNSDQKEQAYVRGVLICFEHSDQTGPENKSVIATLPSHRY